MKVEFFLRYRLSETLITLLTINASTFERYQKLKDFTINFNFEEVLSCKKIFTFMQYMFCAGATECRWKTQKKLPTHPSTRMMRSTITP